MLLYFCAVWSNKSGSWTTQKELVAIIPKQQMWEWLTLPKSWFWAVLWWNLGIFENILWPVNWILPKNLSDICVSLTAGSKVCLQTWETNKRNLWRAPEKTKWESSGKGAISCSLLEWFQGKTNRCYRKTQPSKRRKGKTWREKVLVEQEISVRHQIQIICYKKLQVKSQNHWRKLLLRAEISKGKVAIHF